MSSFDDGGGYVQNPFTFETSTIIDIATDGVLIANAWYVYNDLNFRRQDLMRVSGDPHVILVQVSVVLIGIYLMQALKDWKMG